MAVDGSRLLRPHFCGETSMMGLTDMLAPLQNIGRIIVQEGSATSTVHLRMKAIDLLGRHQDRSGLVKRKRGVFG